jgi:A/G-specific adenine glycosylase
MQRRRPVQVNRSADDRGPRRESLAALGAWYRRNRRALPWRRTRDPYAIWVAEVMLQQTTVKTVLRYYQTFMEHFPTVAALAEAAEEAVLATWSGLGYYHRARNLHRGARHLLAQHAGQFPRALPTALAIPGVGLYTASAVLSIAHDTPLAVVDGNVRRVLARVYALRGPEWQRDAAFYNLATELLERTSPGEWNQALMELGATVCTPAQPGCAACPIASPCQARRLGIQEELPATRQRRRPVAVTVAVALIQDNERVLMVRRPEGRVLGRLWEIPQTGLESRGREDLEHELAETYGLAIVPGALLAVGRHAITYRRIRLEVYAARLTRPPAHDPDRSRWVTPAEIAALPVSSITHKVLRATHRRQIPLHLA